MKKFLIVALFTSITVTNTTNAAQSKKLISREIAQLNTILTIRPMGTVRIMAAYQESIKINKLIPELKTKSLSKEEEMAFVAKHLGGFLAPVKEFFDIIREHKSVITPIIKESLITAETKDMPILLRYFDTNGDTIAYFEKEINSLDTMQKACGEFITFVGDLWASLNKDTKEAYTSLIKNIKQSRQ